MRYYKYNIDRQVKEVDIMTRYVTYIYILQKKKIKESLKKVWIFPSVEPLVWKKSTQYFLKASLIKTGGILDFESINYYL